MKSNLLFISWENNDDTGIPILDEQHRGMIATMNSLYYFIQTGYGLEALKPTLTIIKEYMGFHFVTEKMVLDKHNYPITDEHESSHATMFADFKIISQECIAHKEPKVLLRFLRDWWITHINEEHKEYAKYLKK